MDDSRALSPTPGDCTFQFRQKSCSFLLTGWPNRLCCESRESGPPPAWGWCSSLGLRQADLGQIIDEVGYSLVLEGVIDL